mmetsp:Transcript_72685/g.188720  ORF Transcript_72685/g.188720 Transcript_72685/m.188720 type:complete len:209 (+) Transcript_72685:1255-1881(+)
MRVVALLELNKPMREGAWTEILLCVDYLLPRDIQRVHRRGRGSDVNRREWPQNTHPIAVANRAATRLWGAAMILSTNAVLLLVAHVGSVFWAACAPPVIFAAITVAVPAAHEGVADVAIHALEEVVDVRVRVPRAARKCGFLHIGVVTAQALHCTGLLHSDLIHRVGNQPVILQVMQRARAHRERHVPAVWRWQPLLRALPPQLYVPN